MPPRDEARRGRNRDADPAERDEPDLKFLRRELNKMARAQLHLREKFFTLHQTLNAMQAAVKAGEDFAYPDELLPVVAMKGDDREVLFLAFSGLNLALGMPHAEFLKSLSRRGYPGYFIKDFRQSWYQQGLLGISQDPHQTAEYLRGLVKAAGCRRLVTLGASSGGYAAILFGAWLGADRALAFSPQTAITKRIVAQYASIDTPEPTDFLRRNPQLLDLRGFIDSHPTVPEITVYYGADHAKDPEEAMRLEGHPKVKLVGVPDVVGHTVTAELKSRGELDGILDQLVRF